MTKNTSPRLNKPFEVAKFTLEREGRYFRREARKKYRFALRRTSKGDRQSAIPSLIREPSVVLTRITIKIRERICPSRSISEDFAGSWLAVRIVVIMRRTN